MTTRWGKSFHDTEDTSNSDSLPLLLLPCTSLEQWLPIANMVSYVLSHLGVSLLRIRVNETKLEG